MKLTNRKSFLTIVLAIMMTVLSLVAIPCTKASASTTMTDKNKTVLYYREHDYVYHASCIYHNYIRVAKSLANKKVYLRYINPSNKDAEWQQAEAEYVADLDDNYEIYEASCGAMGVTYDCDVMTVSDEGTYIDDNDGKHYSKDQLGVAPLYVERPDCAPVNYQYSYVYVNLQNFGYNKDVKVRYTTDKWATYKEAPLSYKSTLQDGTESWEGIMDTRGGDYDTVEYAVSYTVNGVTYWDNNFGRNYTGSYQHHGL